MWHIDGFVIPVPAANKEAFRQHAARMARMFKEAGALNVVRAWGDEVPPGEVTSFDTAVLRTDGETVVFSWVVWSDKTTRGRAFACMGDAGEMPFDDRRPIFGGFMPFHEA